VAETGVLFGGVRHYRDYHFLVALSDHANPGNGLEHHESTDVRLPERALVDPNQMRPFLTLLPHEFTHSWNGKYRRPAGMVTSDYNTPMTFDLLWVYEGLTEYLGEVLTGRSGLCAPRECRDELAWTAARMDHERGRTWRSLQDTVDATSVLQFASDQWGWWRRRYTSVYDEGVLIWLEVDTIIRQQTGDKRSIDDFSRLFYGGTGGRPAVSAYTFDDVVDALGRIAPYGWRGLLNERLTSLNPHAPLGGLENGGWRLVYDETPNPYIVAAGEDGVDLVYSIGVRVDRDGTIADVVPGSPADNAGVVPGMKLVGVDGRQGAADLLREAVRNSRTAPGPLIIELTNGNSKETHSLDYHSGARYPHLARIEGRPDMLTEILRPHAQEQK
jgi:predicted metalloprotease with PDZ domain